MNTGSVTALYRLRVALENNETSPVIAVYMRKLVIELGGNPAVFDAASADGKLLYLSVLMLS